VTIEQDAFELYQQGVATHVPLQMDLSESLGRTVALLTFQGPSNFGGDGDEVVGGNYVDEFFRLFGDADGDGDVDTADAVVIKPEQPALMDCSLAGTKLGPGECLLFARQSRQ
jgi:hypothetical protein